MNKKMNKVQTDLVEQARQLRIQAEELEKTAKLARGTKRLERSRANTPVMVRPTQSRFWTGNEGTTPELMEVIATMLTERPWLYRDIVEATGAGENRIKGAITALQREGRRVLDVAPPHLGKALWFIPSDAVLTRLNRVKRATAKPR